MSGFVLNGIDGSNPLGFLAALGTLRKADGLYTDYIPTLGWRLHGGAWRPFLQFEGTVNEAEFVSRLHETLREMDGHPVFGFADNLSIEPSLFRKEALNAVSNSTVEDRFWLDFIAAFGTDSIHDDRTGKIADTAFRTMSGAGHQHFLGTIRQLIRDTEEEHINKALFSEWLYDDPVEKHTMRWDPIDDVRYALQWKNPSGDPDRRTGGSVWGANRLAVEALPLLPTAPSLHRLETTGFLQQKGSRPIWTWPIWNLPITTDIVRSLLGLAELQQDQPNRNILKSRGIVEVYRCQRLTQGKFRNFTLPWATV